MATLLTTIKDTIATRLQAANIPATIITWHPSTWQAFPVVAMRWAKRSRLEVEVSMGSGPEKQAYQTLDDLAAPDGDLSITKAVLADGTLGDTVSTIDLVEISAIEPRLFNLERYPGVKFTFNISAVNITEENWAEKKLTTLAFSNDKVAGLIPPGPSVEVEIASSENPDVISSIEELTVRIQSDTTPGAKWSATESDMFVGLAPQWEADSDAKRDKLLREELFASWASNTQPYSGRSPIAGGTTVVSQNQYVASDFTNIQTPPGKTVQSIKSTTSGGTGKLLSKAMGRFQVNLPRMTDNIDLTPRVYHVIGLVRILVSGGASAYKNNSGIGFLANVFGDPYYTPKIDDADEDKRPKVSDPNWTHVIAHPTPRNNEHVWSPIHLGKYTLPHLGVYEQAQRTHETRLTLYAYVNADQNENTYINPIIEWQVAGVMFIPADYGFAHIIEDKSAPGETDDYIDTDDVIRITHKKDIGVTAHLESYTKGETEEGVIIVPEEYPLQKDISPFIYGFDLNAIDKPLGKKLSLYPWYWPDGATDNPRKTATWSSVDALVKTDLLVP